MTGVEILLGSIFLLSNVFWATQCHVLINKLMSRNYNEFKVSETAGKEPKKEKKNRVEGFLADDMGQFSELM